MQKNTSNSAEKIIVFHKDKVLLCHRSIFWNTEFPSALAHQISRKITLDSMSLVELASFKTGDELVFENGQWMTVKEALNVIDIDHFSMLVKGLSILKWDKQHQFCGACAKKTILTEQLFERHCVDCNAHYYPRISPAIIVLIHRGDQVLMARSSHFPPGAYGLIAGFVEVGETLEAAVHREVFEEVGIKIKNLSYYGSQPWPFPDSMMIGFTAEYESGDILIEPNELEDAGWYQYDQLPGFPSTSISISAEMLNQFAAKILH